MDTRATRPGLATRLTVAAASRDDRLVAIVLLGLAVPWLVYTRLYFFLQPRHLTFDGGLLMWAFNKPDPTCGLTRTFAWMWRGDLLHAVAVYPLGPLIVFGTVGAICWAAAVLLSGRTVGLQLSRVEWRALILIGVVALALNWASKLIWLGM